jgi:hypothetical protein
LGGIFVEEQQKGHHQCVVKWLARGPIGSQHANSLLPTVDTDGCDVRLAFTVDRDAQREQFERCILARGHPRAELSCEVRLVATLDGTRGTRELESSAGQVSGSYVPGESKEATS